MAVTGLIDAPAVGLTDALEAVRSTPAPVGLHPARVAVLARAAAQLTGVYLRDLAAVEPAAAGCRSTADLLVQHAGLPVRQARTDAALADRLSTVPGLLDALADGAVELAAARQLTKAWRALPVRLRDPQTASALIALAGLVDLATLTAKVVELVAALAPEVTDADLADARDSAELTLIDVGAQTVLGGHTDALDGEWLREVLFAKAEADRGQNDGRSSGGRLLDALLDCVRVAVDAGVVPRTDGAPPCLVIVSTPDDLARVRDAAAAAVRPEDALVDLFTDTDLLPTAALPGGRDGVEETGGRGPRWTTRSRGGVPLGPYTLAALCCTASLTRLLLDPAGHPLDSTPAARQINRRERRALEHRAGYRCERAGCGRPAYTCVPHHVVPWALGGPSTQANSVLLCRSCHHLLHDRQQPLRLTGGRSISPTGWLHGGPAP